MAARSLNKVMLIGNLTRDPELRYTSNGTAVVSFGIATNRSYTPANSNEAVENVEFHNIVAWAKLAELCDKLLNKGDKVYLEGRLQTRDWEDEQSGKKMYRTEVVANEMIILSNKKDNSSGAEYANKQSQEPTQSEVPSTGDSEVQDNDIPF